MDEFLHRGTKDVNLIILGSPGVGKSGKQIPLPQSNILNWLLFFLFFFMFYLFIYLFILVFASISHPLSAPPNYSVIHHDFLSYSYFHYHLTTTDLVLLLIIIIRPRKWDARKSLGLRYKRITNSRPGLMIVNNNNNNNNKKRESAE